VIGSTLDMMHHEVVTVRNQRGMEKTLIIKRNKPPIIAGELFIEPMSQRERTRERKQRARARGRGHGRGRKGRHGRGRGAGGRGGRGGGHDGDEFDNQGTFCVRMRRY
jgi:hypothetical protein